MTPQDAVDFFAQQVTQQAQREGKPLSEPEQRMLRWSEVIPGLEASSELNDAFEEVTDSESFEKKVRELLKHARPAASSPEATTWGKALAALRGQDAYILVMLPPAPRSAKDVFLLFASGLLVVGVAGAFMLALGTDNWFSRLVHELMLRDSTRGILIISVIALVLLANWGWNIWWRRRIDRMFGLRK